MDMSLEDAVELGKCAIYQATHRDAGSGGVDVGSGGDGGVSGRKDGSHGRWQ